jgi:hypothetical protein
MRTHRTLFLTVTALVAAVAAWVFFGGMSQASEAGRIVSVCSKSATSSACYEREVSALFPQTSLTDIFSTIRSIRAQDSKYQFCHVLAHTLGEAVVTEDPERWIEAMSQNPQDGLCSNGFIHGVIGGRFRAEVLDDETLQKLTPDFSRACESRATWQASSLDQAMCYHGMGHLYMFITDADIPKALSLCERTAQEKGTGDYRRVCREGVFMQIYQPLEPDDFLMLERMERVPNAQTVREFCSAFTNNAYEGACLRESWPLFRQDIVSGSGVDLFCSGQPDEQETKSCYESAFSIIGRMSIGTPQSALDACAQVHFSHKRACYAYAARAVLEESRKDGEAAIALCAAAPSRYKAGCMEDVLSTAHFIFGNNIEASEQLCRTARTYIDVSCTFNPAEPL